MIVGDLASGIAAIAALLTVYYARETVVEARRSREEASTAHGEEMLREGQLLTATQTAQQLGGPALDEIKQKAVNLRGMNTRPELVVGEMMAALDQTRFLAQEHESFRAPQDD